MLYKYAQTSFEPPHLSLRECLQLYETKEVILPESGIYFSTKAELRQALELPFAELEEFPDALDEVCDCIYQNFTNGFFPIPQVIISVKRPSFAPLRSYKHRKIEWDGYSLIIPPEVFTPLQQLSWTTSMVRDQLPQDLSGKKILDIGTGPGTLSLSSLKRGALHVVAADIINEALHAADYNIQQAGFVNYTLHHSDLFRNIPTGSFDYILANLPIKKDLWSDQPSISTLIDRFLSEATSYLTSGGKILIPWASFGDLSSLQLIELFKKSGYSICSHSTAFELGYVWDIFELTPAEA